MDVRGTHWMGWGACLLLCGCLPDPMFPDEPTLSFDSFEAMDNGTATMTLGFTDGDGNVGLSQGDTLPPFCATCPNHHNLIGVYQQWDGEEWVTPPLLVPYAYRVPAAEPTGSSPALEGTIALSLTSWYLAGTTSDSVRFQWTLWDRDLQPSNTVTTPALAVP